MEDTVKPLRNERGQLLPGQTSINPSGRPPIPPEVRREAHQILTAATPRAAQRLVELLEDQDPRIAFAAASTLLDRVLGKAVTSVDQTVNVSTSIQQAHLAALIEIQKRRKDRLAEEKAGTTDQEIIDVTPQSEE